MRKVLSWASDEAPLMEETCIILYRLIAFITAWGQVEATSWLVEPNYSDLLCHHLFEAWFFKCALVVRVKCKPCFFLIPFFGGFTGGLSIVSALLVVLHLLVRWLWVDLLATGTVHSRLLGHWLLSWNPFEFVWARLIVMLSLVYKEQRVVRSLVGNRCINMGFPCCKFLRVVALPLWLEVGLGVFSYWRCH